MTTRVILKHDDASFVERLSSVLRADGHEVIFPDQAVAGPTPSGMVEVTVNQKTGTYPGVRIMLTGATGALYPGGLATFLAEPVTPEGVAGAVRRFGFSA
jgi:hypothetical protein